MELDYESMLESGVHFGHQTKRWNPKFGPYLYKQRMSLLTEQHSLQVQLLKDMFHQLQDRELKDRDT